MIIICLFFIRTISLSLWCLWPPPLPQHPFPFPFCYPFIHHPHHLHVHPTHILCFLSFVMSLSTLLSFRNIVLVVRCSVSYVIVVIIVNLIRYILYAVSCMGMWMYVCLMLMMLSNYDFLLFFFDSQISTAATQINFSITGNMKHDYGYTFVCSMDMLWMWTYVILILRMFLYSLYSGFAIFPYFQLLRYFLLVSVLLRSSSPFS